MRGCDTGSHEDYRHCELRISRHLTQACRRVEWHEQGVADQGVGAYLDGRLRETNPVNIVDLVQIIRGHRKKKDFEDAGICLWVNLAH